MSPCLFFTDSSVQSISLAQNSLEAYLQEGIQSNRLLVQSHSRPCLQSGTAATLRHAFSAKALPLKLVLTPPPRRFAPVEDGRRLGLARPCSSDNFKGGCIIGRDLRITDNNSRISRLQTVQKEEFPKEGCFAVTCCFLPCPSLPFLLRKHGRTNSLVRSLSRSSFSRTVSVDRQSFPGCRCLEHQLVLGNH